MESGDPELEAIGQELYWTLDALIDERSTLTAWTHTAVSQGDGTLNHSWWMDLAFDEGLDYSLPLDSQEDYDRLHQALSLIFLPAELGAYELKGVDLSSTTGAGNSLDAIDLIQDPAAGGWPDDAPSWVRPIRDGPLIHDGSSRNAYYFLSSGADTSIGTNTYRKKELWPVDQRERTHVVQLADAVQDIGLEGESGLYNLPGMSWELGTLVNLSEGGAYRETLMYGQNVTEENWEYVFRSMRRLLAMADPDETKSWYQHIFDVTNPNGLFTSNSRVTEAGSVKGDVNAAAFLRIQSELIDPGYARWSLPEEIAAEASSE